MEKIKISEVFMQQYLSVGNLQFNTVIPSCPMPLVEIAKASLAKSNDWAKSCIVEINREQELLVEKTLDSFENDDDKKLIARDFVCSLIMIELLKGDINKSAQSNLMKVGVKAICGKNQMPAKEYHKFAPMPCDISFKAMRLKKVELTFLLINTENKYIQQAINNFLSSRDLHLKTKIFTTNEILPSCYDQMGSLVQSIHDYILVSTDSFVDYNDNDTIME